MKADAGKWAEREAKLWLEKHSNEVLAFAYHRYPDARAARGALAAQPADFLIANGSTFHLEVKETAQINRLPKAKISQYGTLLKFHYAGVIPYVVVYRSACKDWICLGPAELFGFEECPASFDMTQRPTFATCGEILRSLFT